MLLSHGGGGFRRGLDGATRSSLALRSPVCLPAQRDAVMLILSEVSKQSIGTEMHREEWMHFGQEMRNERRQTQREGTVRDGSSNGIGAIKRG